MFVIFTIFLMALTPQSISSVLASSTPKAAAVVAAPVASSSGGGTVAQSNADKLAAIKQNNLIKQAQGLINNMTPAQQAEYSQVTNELQGVHNYLSDVATTGGASVNNPIQAANSSMFSFSKIPQSNVTNTPIQTTQPLKLDLSPKQRVQVGNIASQYSSALSSAKGDRSAYNASINYDSMNTNRKRVADNFFDRNSKVKKEETPYDENPAITAEKIRQAEENRKQQELLEQQRKDQLATDESVMNANEARYNQEEGDTTGERDKTIAEQEAMAQSAESNRLNQLRGNIMSRLAQRGVDISRLSPEQITALSGEEGSKAFMDVADIKDRKTKTIESVRQSALAKLNELRDKKSLNQTAYTSRVNEINSKTAAAKLQAEKEFGANVFALTQTKEQQSRADALARVNAAQTYLTAAGVGGEVAANAIASLTTRGLPDETIRSIAKSPAFITQLKAIEAANVAQKNIDNALKQGKLNIDEYKAQTARIAANRPRSAGGITIIGDAGQFGSSGGN